MNYKKIIPGKTAFQLLRTNPKLTGNIKLTIGDDGIWLNSIDANAEMAKDQYKKYAVDIKHPHPYHVYKMLNDGKVPSDQLFYVREDVGFEKVPSDYKDQYDYSQYWAGAKYLVSKFYDQKLSYFAPIHLGDNMPDHFVIMKIKSPMNNKSDVSKLIYESGQQTSSEYFKEMMRGAIVIKDFDLTERTDHGKYLRSITTNSAFPKKALTVSYRKEALTYYAGTYFKNGIYTKRGENLAEFFSSDRPIKNFEDHITKGFERNGIIHPWIINVEFIFDDPTAVNYEMSRYVGFYINEVQLAELKLNESSMFNAGLMSKKDYISNGEIYDPISDSDGVKLIVDSSDTIDSTNLVYDKNETIFFTYIKDKNKHIRTLSYSNPLDVVDGTLKSVRLEETSVDISDFFGADDTFIQDKGVLRDTLGRSNVELLASKFGYGDKIRIFYTLGSRTSSEGHRYDDFECIMPYGDASLWTDSPIRDPGDFYSYYGGQSIDDEGNAITCDIFYFNGTNVNNNANYITALARAINATKHKFFSAYPMGDKLLICVGQTSDCDSITSIQYIPKNRSSYANVSIESVTGSALENTKISFSGGTSYTNRIAVDSKYESAIRANIGDLLLAVNGGWSKVKAVSLDEDVLTDSVADQLDNDYRPIRGAYQSKAVVTIHNESDPSINENTFRMAKYFKISMGIMSFIPYMDFDFDFYSSSYNKFPEWELYKYFYVPPGLNLLKDKVTYRVVNGSITYKDQPYSSIGSPINNLFTVITPDGYSKSYTTLTDWNQNAIVAPINYSQKYSGLFELKRGDVYRVVNGIIRRNLVNSTYVEFGYGIFAGSPGNMTNEFSIDSELDNIPLGFADSFTINLGTDLYLQDLTVNEIVYPDTKLMKIGHKYAVKTLNVTPGISIKYNGSTHSPGDIITASYGQYSYLLDFEIVSGSPKVIYQQIHPNDIKLIIGSEYIVVGEGIISYNNVLYSENQTFFAEYDSSLLYSYQAVDPDAFVVYYSDPTGNIAINDEDKDIASFPGYFKLKDSNTTSNVITDKYINRDKFYEGVLKTEYDFYKENYTKDFAYTSKIVPYVCKWGFANSIDARSNPYRLNTANHFGLDNMSPSHYIVSQDPTRLTHEWQYLQAKYEFMSDPHVKAMNYSYFDIKFDVDKFITDSEYFTEYFSYTPTYKGLDVSETQHRYSFITYNEDTKLCETMFRGVFMRIKDVSSDVAQSDGRPAYKLGSARFDGYKFSTLIMPIEEKINELYSEPISHRLIENADAKAIVLLTTIKLPHVGQLGDKALNNEIIRWQTPTFSTDYNQANGDYRFSFNSEGLSDLTYIDLYSISNKKYNTKLESYSNIKISSWLNFNVSDYTHTNKINADSYQINNFSEIKLTDELKNTGPDNYILINSFGKGAELLSDLEQISYDAVFCNNVSLTNGLTAITDSGLYYGANISSIPKKFHNMYGDALALTAQSASYFSNKSYKQLFGGKGYFKSIFSKLAFSNIKSLMNSVSKSISVETYSSGKLTKSNTFYFEMPDPTIVNKTEILINDIDTERPDTYSHDSVIGYVFLKAPTSHPYQMARYEGGYDPIFKPVLFHERSFDTGSTAITLANVSFARNIDSFGIVNNMGMLKVADAKIMKLQDDDKYRMVYEYISEIATDKVDLNVFKSNWEYGYHFKYTDKNKRLPVAGSLRIEEDFFTGGKTMDVPNSIELRNPIIGTDFTYTLGSTSAKGNIDLTSQIITNIVESGALVSISKWLIDDPEYIGFNGLRSYVESYVRTNIINLYRIDVIEFWVLYNGDAGNISFVTGLTDKELSKLGYVLKRDVLINKTNRFSAEFTITRETNRGMIVAPVAKIKLI